MATVLYARVSTTDQNIGHQETQARAAGFPIDLVIADDGVSGVSTTLAERPQGRRLYDVLRAGDTLVVRWVDRLGRNYADVTDAIRHFMRKGVVIQTVINNMTFNGATKDPIEAAVRDALIGFMAATAQAQAEATKVAQRAGIERSKADLARQAYRGRKPSYTRQQLEKVSELVTMGNGASAIAKATGLHRQAVLRIIADPVKAEAVLARWS
jgi:DNA invertase Pin-like site-specific DNA recombinase